MKSFKYAFGLTLTVEQINSKEAVVIFGDKHVLRIPPQEIILNQHNRRWECEVTT